MRLTKRDIRDIAIAMLLGAIGAVGTVFALVNWWQQ